MSVYCRDIVTIFAAILLFFSLLYVEYELPKSDWVEAFLDLFKKEK